MARVKGGIATKKHHKKILKQAKGYYGALSKQYRSANQAVMRAMANAYIGRKRRATQSTIFLNGKLSARAE